MTDLAILVAIVAALTFLISTTYLAWCAVVTYLARRRRRRQFDALGYLREHRRAGLSDREVVDALAPTGQTGTVSPFPVRPPIDYRENHR